MTERIRIRRTRAYKVVMSTGEPVQIEQEEVQKVIAGALGKGLILVKRGMINPAYIVTVVEDGERVRAWNTEGSYNAVEADGMTQGEKARMRGMKPLACIFEGEVGERIRKGAIESAKALGLEMSTEQALLGNAKDHGNA